jgi:imidazolonepropionase-like amidohydrolase
MKNFQLKPTLLLLLLTIHLSEITAQKYFPENGPANPTSECFAIVNATIWQDADNMIKDATLIIRNGKVEACGKNIIPPRDAQIIQAKGRFVYPAFIDLFTNYGMPHKHDDAHESENKFVSSKAKQPYGWNEAIRAEQQAAQVFAADAKQAAMHHQMGIGAALTHIQDGISRGTAALVHIANTNSHQSIINEQQAAAFSFKKGSSKQPYPQSLMGSIALLRQSYYDAQWHKQQKEQSNLTLDALLSQMGMLSIFEASNQLDILRAAQIKDEFKLNYIVKTTGDEYRNLDAIKQTGIPLIVPVNFPKPYSIQSPLDAQLISTTDLMHWEIAPQNISMIVNKQIPFCITTSGCESANEFFNNLYKTKQFGVSDAALLRALTETPAKMLNQYKQLGSLHPGKFANFIITSNPLFESNSQINEVWSLGIRHMIQPYNEINWSGTYSYPQHTVIINNKGKDLLLIGATDTVTFRTTIAQGKLSAQTGKTQLLLISLTLDSSVWPYQVKTATLRLTDEQGKTISNNLNYVGNAQPQKVDSIKSIVIQPHSSVVFPFTDFGWQQQPKQEHIVFRNATVWTSEQQGILTQTDVEIRLGKVVAIGKNLPAKNAKEIDATGKHLTAGIIDEHSHIAIERGVNEGTQAVTAEVRIGDAVDNLDINIYRQLSGGVVGAQLLHGSANPIGGQSALIKLRWGLTPEQMKIEQAPGFIKFALGENVKQSNWGDRATVRYPQTRMGVEQIMMDAFLRARAYEQQKNKRRDLELDALVEILNKKRFISCHSYVQSEINMLMHLADSFGFTVNTFTHILEGYKVADKMKKHGAQASSFADWWAYKFEVIEAIPYNAAVLTRMGVNTAINSDDAEMGRRLNQEAAKAIKYGNVTEEQAWNMVTINPAKMLKLDNRMGSIKPGKDADLVLWSDNPLSIYAKALQTYLDGRCYFDRDTDEQQRTNTAGIRQRIITNMTEAIKNGESPVSFTSKKQIVYHCDTEHEEEHTHE